MFFLGYFCSNTFTLWRMKIVTGSEQGKKDLHPMKLAINQHYAAKLCLHLHRNRALHSLVFNLCWSVSPTLKVLYLFLISQSLFHIFFPYQRSIKKRTPWVQNTWVIVLRCYSDASFWHVYALLDCCWNLILVLLLNYISKKNNVHFTDEKSWRSVLFIQPVTVCYISIEWLSFSKLSSSSGNYQES